MVGKIITTPNAKKIQSDLYQPGLSQGVFESPEVVGEVSSNLKLSHDTLAWNPQAKCRWETWSFLALPMDQGLEVCSMWLFPDVNVIQQLNRPQNWQTITALTIAATSTTQLIKLYLMASVSHPKAQHMLLANLENRSVNEITSSINIQNSPIYFYTMEPTKGASNTFQNQLQNLQTTSTKLKHAITCCKQLNQTSFVKKSCYHRQLSRPFFCSELSWPRRRLQQPRPRAMHPGGRWGKQLLAAACSCKLIDKSSLHWVCTIEPSDKQHCVNIDEQSTQHQARIISTERKAQAPFMCLHSSCHF